MAERFASLLFHLFGDGSDVFVKLYVTDPKRFFYIVFFDLYSWVIKGSGSLPSKMRLAADPLAAR